MKGSWKLENDWGKLRGRARALSQGIQSFLYPLVERMATPSPPVSAILLTKYHVSGH